MWIIPGLALSLTLIVLTNAGFVDPDVVVPKTDPDPVVPETPPKEYPPSPPIDEPPPAQAPGEQPGENESESDIGEALSDILDAITSIISLAGGTSTVVPSAISLPTAAHPCLSAQNLFNSCASRASSSYAAAPSTQVCFAPLPCVEEPSGPDTATANIQSSCLCPQATSTSAPGIFDGYLGSCNNYVQNQTQLATQSGLTVATAFCSSAPTTAAVSITSTLPTVTPTTATQAFSSAATVLSPMMSSRSWYIAWWTVILLVGSGWAAYIGRRGF